MTVQAELNGDAQSLEYIACIEGIGWPSDIHDLTAGWQGTVMVSADQAGTLAAILTDGAEVFSCAVAGGLIPPSAFSDSIDPVTMEFSLGAADFDVVNPGAWIDDVISPRKDTEQTGAEGAGRLQTALTYQSTTVDIYWVNPGGTTDPLDQNDVAWIGGREAVLLGARAVNAPGFRYTGCTRGYLGTPRGTWDARASWQGQRLFKVDTTVYPFNPFWRGRRVAIFAHVPGEARGNCVRVFLGRLTNVKRQGHGTVWAFSATADAFLGHRRVREAAQYAAKSLVGPLTDGRMYTFFRDAENVVQDGVQQYSAYYMYRYRTVPGGSALPGVTEYAPQAEIGSITLPEIGDVLGDNLALAQTLVKVGGDALVRLLAHLPTVVGSGVDYRHFFATVVKNPGAWTKLGDPVVWLLDTLQDEAGPNRFTVNNIVRHNVIDQALIWMTSCDSEFFRADAAAAGTTTTVNFTAPGWMTDQWVGYALHCVEGTNKGQARVITGNDADTITVDTAFSAATHVGNEYQIRNSIYDVLPWGWGLQIHNVDINIDAWEDLRDRYLPDAVVGKYAVGDDPETDYWDLLVENLFRPYGIMPYVNRATGKLKPRFIFSLTTDAAFETLTAVTDADLLPGSFEDLDLLPRQPVTAIEITTRQSGQPLVSEGGGPLLTIRAGDAELHYDANERGKMEITALLNDEDSLGELGAMHVARLRDLVKPCYESTIYLHNRLMLLVQAGSLLSITSTACAVRDPYTNTAGLSSRPARVLSSRVRVEPGGETLVECRVQLLDPVDSARVAPACDVTSKGAVGPDEYFVIDWDNYVDEPVAYTVTDFMLFRAGDRVELRDVTGALKEGPFTIVDFGSNHSSDPTTADQPWIFLLEVIASAIVAGDYLTFYQWDNSSTANMELYSAYADVTDEELGAGDAPKEYL